MAVVPNPKVTLQYTQEVNRLLPGGRNEARIYASFLVGKDGPFNIEMPMADYSPDALWTLINTKADAVAALRA